MSTFETELARILGVTASAVYHGALATEGDLLVLCDFNGDDVGDAQVVPDWRVGDVVWVTAFEGALVKARIRAITEHPLPGFVTVDSSQWHGGEPMSSVVVDRHGKDPHGRPLLGRAR